MRSVARERVSTIEQGDRYRGEGPRGIEPPT